MKLLRLGSNTSYLPKSLYLKTLILEDQKPSLVVASDSTDVRPTKKTLPPFLLNDQERLLKLANIAEFKNQMIIKININSDKLPKSLSELLDTNPDIYIFEDRNNKLFSLDVIYDIVPNNIKSVINYFSVGRYNGPTDKVVDAVKINDTYIKYDVNGRIELDSKGNKLTFTFMPIAGRNMGRLTLPNDTQKVVIQANFDLYRLGLLVLTREYKEASDLFNKLING